MRHVDAPFLGHSVSALGFGCASLGSRVSERDGRAAIERALAAGVTWYDVAPSYGAGQAERILGEALAGAPHAQIVTKVGLAPAKEGGLKRLAGGIVRPLVAAIPGLRGLVKRARGAAAARVPLDGETIRTGLARSLERLKRDCVAVYCLHGPSIEDVTDADVQRALDDIRRQRLAAAIGIAGEVEVWRAAKASGCPADVAQMPIDVLSGTFDALDALPARDQPRFRVGHSVFGVDGAYDRLRRRAHADKAFAAALRRLGYGTGPADLARLLIDAAFSANPDGVVLTSAYKAAHLEANAASAWRTPEVALMRALEVLLAQGTASRPHKEVRDAPA